MTIHDRSFWNGKKSRLVAKSSITSRLGAATLLRSSPHKRRPNCRRAARHGRSTEAEHREILRQALAGDVEPSFDTLAAELRKLTKRRKQTPSEVLLREGREER